MGDTMHATIQVYRVSEMLEREGEGEVVVGDEGDIEKDLLIFLCFYMSSFSSCIC